MDRHPYATRQNDGDYVCLLDAGVSGPNGLESKRPSSWVRIALAHQDGHIFAAFSIIGRAGFVPHLFSDKAG